MIGFDEAIARLIGEVRTLGVERVPVANAQGRVLAKPVQAESDFPLNVVSTMDGWAVRDEDLATLPARLRIAGESWPGRPFFGPISPGECARVFTGAAIPANAPMVVIQEIARRDGDHAVFEDPAVGTALACVSPATTSAPARSLPPTGTRLDPASAGRRVAAADAATVETWRSPQLIVLSTGDELAGTSATAGARRRTAFPTAPPSASRLCSRPGARRCSAASG